MAYTTIKKPSDYFNTKLYTGNGSTNAITGVGFQPDFTWIKDRTNAYGHDLYDVIRGATNRIQSNDTGAEGTYSTGLTSFDSDGFTLGSYIGSNTNTANYASWNWLASNTTASNTDGSITSTVSANTTSGFSISTFTTPASGTFTVGHGLGVAPKMIIYRPTGSSSWQVGHNSIGWTNFLTLNGTSGSSASTAFGNTAPTTSVWTGNTANVGANAFCVAYCFAEKKGFSKFGSYIGNGSTDGTFVYTGFKPAFVLVKNTAAVTSWQLIDNKRSDAGGYNIIDKVLAPNASDAEYDEGSSAWCGDLLSNGFKWRGNWGALNGSGQTHIYMAFAEEPLVGDNPATAR